MKPPKLVLAIPSLLTLAAPAGAEILERVVAKVNGDIVTLSEFEARQVAAVQSSRVGPERIEVYLRDNNARILQEAIDDLLLTQRAQEIGIKIRPDYTKDVIEGIKKENNLGSDEALEEQLRREGLSLDNLKRQIERSILRRQVLAREVEEKAVVSETEAQADYEARRGEYARPASVRLQEILVKGEDAATRAAAIVARARAGEDFAALARAHSQAESRDSGGDLGLLHRGELTPEVERAAFALEPGAVSDPIPTSDGVHVLRLVERTEGSVVPFEQVKREIQQRLGQERFAREYDTYIEGLRKTAVIDVKVREVPLQVNVPPGGTLLEVPAPPGAATPESEITTTPQERPEHVVPAEERKKDEPPSPP